MISMVTDRQRARVQWRKLTPLNELNPQDLDYLVSESILRDLSERTLITAEPHTLVFLLEGTVSLLAGGFVTESFNHLQQRAAAPLFDESLDEDSAVLTSAGRILEVDRSKFEGLRSQHKAATLELRPVDLNRSENQLFQALTDAYMQNRLDLPVLPEAAFRIRHAIAQPDVSSAEIIEIVQTDPVLSARLIKVANSSLYGTWREISNVRDAVRRLGLETTKNLTFSLSVKQLFSAKTNLIRKNIQRLYQESIAVGAIAFVIAERQAKHLDPEQALLSGLILNLGLIPMLKYIDEHPSMMQTSEQLGKSIDTLYVPITKVILKGWNFDPEFIEIIEQSTNWTRDTGKPADYVDLVIAARLLYLDDTGDLPVSTLNDLPIVNKLDLLAIDGDGQTFIDYTREKVEAMQQMLHTT